MVQHQTIKSIRCSLGIVVLIALPISAIAIDISADAVTGMCLDAGKPANVCNCSSAALLSNLGEENYSTYERVGSVYLEELAAGNGRTGAWTSALEAQNLELRTANQFGSSHRAAMNACTLE